MSERVTPDVLNKAVQDDDLKAVIRFLNAGADINAQGRHGAAIHGAALWGRVQILRRLLEAGASVNILGGDLYCPPLQAAAFSGSYACVQLLLNYGADVNAEGGRYQCALQAAASLGNYRIAKILLDHGADVNIRGGTYGSSLYAAADCAHEDLVKMLIEHGADVNVQSIRGTPLRVAVMRSDAAKVELLLLNGARIDEEVMQAAIKKGNKRVLRILLDTSQPAVLPESACIHDLKATAATMLKTEPSPQLDPDLPESPTLTVAHVRTVWEDGLNEYKLISSGKLKRTSFVSNWNSSGPRRRLLLSRNLCNELYRCAQSEPCPFAQLDERLCNIEFIQFDCHDVTKGRDEDSIIHGAYQQLRRLPPTPLPLSNPENVAHLPFCFYLDTGVNDPGSQPVWERLKVTVLMSKLVIRTAIHLACGLTSRFSYRSLLECLAQALNTAAEIPTSSAEDNPRSTATWYIVKCFLWTAWQRIRMLYLNGQLQQQLEEGVDHGVEPLPAMLGQLQLTDGIVKSVEQENKTQDKPVYMCSWAYRLLATQLAEPTMDLRRFFCRYNDLWGSYLPRCKGSRPCSGNSPDECLRFKGATLHDQSAHDWACICVDRCKLMPWDSLSYGGVTGAVGVQVDSAAQVEDKRLITYCEAGGNTLAVSHVWAHGQGGRPETGINRCLHNRYCTIARNLGCDSYWIDVACIPEDHGLRQASIAKINWVFRSSKACLVCDRDVMEIDISELENGSLPMQPKVRLCESILATILLCDWNVRAWTLLEAIQILSLVAQHGSIDIGILFLGAPQLLPMRRQTPFQLFDDMPPFELTPQEKLLQQKYLGLEDAAQLIRHRPASRNGDIFVIWRLLTNSTSLDTPQDLWKSRDGFTLATGFILSGTRRVQGVPGLSWAPADPVAVKLIGLFHKRTEVYPMMELQGTAQGRITPKGLVAPWKVFKFGISSEGRWSNNDDQITAAENELFMEELRHATKSQFQCSQDTVALLRPLAGIMQPGDKSPAKSHIETLSQFVALCEFCPGDNGWKWLGARVWDHEIFIPEFTTEEILLI